MRKKKKRNAAGIDTDDFLLDENIPFVVNEAFKALRTSIIFSMPGEGCKTIGITSAHRGDGKSTVAVNLAISLAQLGKRVVLFDCDLRLPTLALKLGIENTPGLTNLLVGEAKVDQCMRTIKQYGISVLPCGRIPPDATKLLGSDRFPKMVEAFRGYYDFILMDFPPVTTVTDAIIVRNVVDGYVVLARHGETEIGEISELITKMGLAGANLLGFVYNGAPVTEKKHYGYYK